MAKTTILLVTSGTFPIDSNAITQAADLASHKSGELHCLYVHDELRWSSTLKGLLPDLQTVKETISERAINTLKSQVDTMGSAKVAKYSVSYGHLFLETIRYCLDNNISMIVKSAKKPSWTTIFFDSEDLHLLRKSPVPVWLTVPNNAQSISSVVVALDFDHDQEPESRNLNKMLLRQGIAMAKMKNAALHLVNVFNIHDLDFVTLWADDPNKLEKVLLEDERVTRQAAMQHIIDEINDESPGIYDTVRYKIHLKNGAPPEIITELVSKLTSPLLIMGSVGRTGIAGLFIGNTAESIFLQVRCSILVLKPEGFVSPVTL